MRKLLFLLFIAITSILSCQKKETNNNFDEDCLRIISSFLSQLGTEKYMNSLDDLLRSNKNINLEDSATIKLRNGFQIINELSGKYYSSKLLRKRLIQNDVALYSYLVKFEKRFYRFQFTFYKADKTINIYKFAYDDTLEFELEESIKLYTD